MWNSAQQASAKKISEPSLRCEFVCIKNKLCQINISETAWYPRIIQNCAHSDLKRNPEPFSQVSGSQDYHHQGANFIRVFVLTVKAWFLYFHPRVFLLQRKYIHIKTTTFVIIYLVFRNECMATGMRCYSTHSCTDIKIMSQPELWPSSDPELVIR